MLAATITTHEGRVWRFLHERTPWLLVAGLVTACYGVMARHIGLPFLNTCTSDFLGGGLGAALILAASHPGLTDRVLSWKPLTFVGGYSYSVYMIHIPLLLIFVQYVLGPINWLLGVVFERHLGHDGTAALCAVLGVPFVLGGAYLFFLGCEKPFLSRAAAGFKFAGRLQTGRHAEDVYGSQNSVAHPHKKDTSAPGHAAEAVTAEGRANPERN